MIDDNKIVDLFLNRDQEAISLCSKYYGDRLRSLAKRICLDEENAKECENDTYLKAWNSIPPHEPRTYLFAFLAKITRFLALDCCKKELRQKRNADLISLSEEIEICIPEKDLVESRFEGELLSRQISEFLRQQTEEKRVVFIRRYWYMDSVSDIAKRYRISEGKVKTILFRMRNDLRVYLEREGVKL